MHRSEMKMRISPKSNLFWTMRSNPRLTCQISILTKLQGKTTLMCKCKRHSLIEVIQSVLHQALSLEISLSKHEIKTGTMRQSSSCYALPWPAGRMAVARKNLYLSIKAAQFVFATLRLKKKSKLFQDAGILFMKTA